MNGFHAAWSVLSHFDLAMRLHVAVLAFALHNLSDVCMVHVARLHDYGLLNARYSMINNHTYVGLWCLL